MSVAETLWRCGFDDGDRPPHSSAALRRGTGHPSDCPPPQAMNATRRKPRAAGTLPGGARLEDFDACGRALSCLFCSSLRLLGRWWARPAHAVPASDAVTAQSPPGAFAITIAEKGPFAPGTAVTVSLSGGPASAYVIVEQCDADGTTCGSGATLSLDATGAGKTAPLVAPAHRHLPTLIDCATTPCQVTARSVESQASASIPIRIDGTAPIIRPVLQSRLRRPFPTGPACRSSAEVSILPLRFRCGNASGPTRRSCPDVDIGYAFTDSAAATSRPRRWCAEWSRASTVPNGPIDAGSGRFRTATSITSSASA